MTDRTTRDDVLDAIKDDDIRRRVGAITDLQQTHLTRRDARDWGDSRS